MHWRLNCNDKLIESKKYRLLFKHSKRLLVKYASKLKDYEKQRLNSILYISDELLNAYYLKEAFYKVLDAPDSTTAKQLMTKWILDAQNSHIPEYLSCSNTLVNWQKGILNSFDVPYSNSFTEGCNNKIKVLKRNAYGYRNFERFRKRILHMFSCHTSTAFSSTCYQIYILQFLPQLLTKSQKIIVRKNWLVLRRKVYRGGNFANANQRRAKK